VTKPKLWGILLLLSCLAVPAPAQDADKTRISQLEERLALLEDTVKALLDERNAIAVAPRPPQAPIEQPHTSSIIPVRTQVTPPELLPEIGKVGAEVGILLSGSDNPYRLGIGKNISGFIDLPLFDQPHWMHGKVSYEISVGLSRVKSTFTTTSNVAQVTNLTVLNAVNPSGGLQNVLDSVTGTGAAPFPVTQPTLTTMNLLQVIPFSLKYTSTVFDRYRLRPYALAGFGTYVTIHVQEPLSSGVRTNANLPPAVLQLIQQTYGGQSPFGGPLVAGQIAQSPELEARGLPSGHGNIDLGWLTGGGLEFRLSRTTSIGVDARWNRIAGAPGALLDFGARLGWHF
jgi:hypothetical protein